MPKTLVVVERPAKAKTIEKYLGGDYTVRASDGHIRDLPKSRARRGRRARLRARLHGPRGVRSATSRELKGPEEGGGPGPCDGLRPRGRGHRVPRRDHPGVVSGRREARDVHRDHQGSDPRGVPRAARDRHEARRRAAGPARARPAGRLPDLAAALEARPPGPVRRPRAVRRGPPDRRARARDPGVQPDRVLERRRPPHARRRPQPFLARLVEVPEGKLAASPDKKGVAARRRARRRPARRTAEPRRATASRMWSARSASARRRRRSPPPRCSRRPPASSGSRRARR